MLDEKYAYKELVEKVVDYAKEEISSEAIESFQKHIETKLADFKPTLMVYGTYNAGKSTLLNALFGKEEMANTGDSPETAEVHGYEYKGYTIYDTPGINAPIEHEEVTSEHLSKCEVVLFVMSNDGSLEEEYVYNRISEIVKANKPLLIVLNNKKNTDPTSKESIDEINKVNINLSKIGDRHGIKNIEDKVSLCMVNAKTALKGKVENKKLLLNRSNIKQLETSIETLLNESGNREVINALNLYIREFIERVISIIDAKIDNPELQKVEELITYLEKFKQKSDIELKNIVISKVNTLENGLRERLLNQSKSDEINQYVEERTDDISHELELKFKKISYTLNEKIEQFTNEMDAISLQYNNINISDKESSDSNSKFLEENIKNVLKNKDLMTNITKETLLKLREFKILFKGKWEKTLGKYAGRFANVLTVAITAYEAYQAYSEHEKQVEAQRQHVLSAKNTSEEFAETLKTNVFNSIDEVLENVFDVLIKEYRTTSNKLNIQHSEVIRNKKNLQNLIYNL
ncbi:MAG TPA: hypothetical protein ENK82_09925 [Campylobacterales bacterium]|nr:hypothetical protein [Campylobacterales bacterium]